MITWSSGNVGQSCPTLVELITSNADCKTGLAANKSDKSTYIVHAFNIVIADTEHV